MPIVPFIIKLALFAYIGTLLHAIIRQRKRFPVYVLVIALAVIGKSVLLQLLGFDKLYVERFNFINPAYYAGESLLALVISGAVLSQSESPDKLKKYLLWSGLAFLLFFLIGFVVLHLFFEMGILTVSIEYELGGAVKLIRFTEQYARWNKSFILINLIELSFTLFWIFNSLYILFTYVYTIISLRIRRTELLEKDILLDQTRGLLILIACLGLLGNIPARFAFEASTLGILATLAVLRGRMGAYFKYEHQHYEDGQDRKHQLVTAFKKALPDMPVPESMQQLAAVAVEIADANAAGVYRYVEGKGLLEPQAFSGPFPPLFPIAEVLLHGTGSLSVIMNKVTTTALPLAGTFMEKAIRERGRLLIADALHDPAVPQYAHRLLNIESLLAVTFLHQDLPYILIAANARDGYPFTEAHLALLVELVAGME